MSFLAPLFLIGAAAAVVPIVLHLLRREPEVRLRFAAVRMLRPSPAERADRRRLRELLLLALRVAALVLLAFAFARPFLASGPARQSVDASIVALDVSLSVSTPGRFERARTLAKDAVRRAQAGGLVGVVVFADAAEIVAPLGADRSLALAALDAASSGFGGTSYRAALAAAAQALDGARGTITVVTDLQKSGWGDGVRALVPESARIALVDVGAPPPNLAVTSVRAGSERVVASVINSAATARDARVRLLVDGKLAGEAVESVGANQSAQIAFPGVRGSTAEVSVDDPEGLSGDNVRYVVLGNTARPALLVITASGDPAGEGFYVEHALKAAGARGMSYDTVFLAGEQLVSWDRARLDRHASVILLSTRGLERHGRELLNAYVRDGGGLLLATGSGVDGEVAADLIDRALSITVIDAKGAPGASSSRSLAPADPRHPVFAAFGAGAASLGLVRFQRISTLRGERCAVLARFTTGETGLAECAVGSGRVLVLASDLGKSWNDFPLHATFVPFLQEAVRYLAGDRRRAAEYLVGSVPAGVAARPGVTMRPDPEHGGESRLVAVNVDPAESDPDRLTPEEFQGAVQRLQDAARSAARLQARQEEDRQRIWQYLLGVMLAVMAVESAIARRSV